MTSQQIVKRKKIKKKEDSYLHHRSSNTRQRIALSNLRGVVCF